MPTKKSKTIKSGNDTDALAKAKRRIEKLKGDDRDKAYEAAYFYLTDKSWKPQGYTSVKEALSQEEVGMSPTTFYRYAKCYQVIKAVHGKYVKGYLEYNLRPLTTLTKDELENVVSYLAAEKITLEEKKIKAVKQIILRALASSIRKDKKFLAAKKNMVDVVSALMEEEELESTSFINLVASAIGEMLEKDLRASLSKTHKA